MFILYNIASALGIFIFTLLMQQWTSQAGNRNFDQASIFGLVSYFIHRQEPY